MKDHRKAQLSKARSERRELLMENVTLEKWRETARTYPPGSVWYWSLGSVYGPSHKREEAVPYQERTAAE